MGRKRDEWEEIHRVNKNDVVLPIPNPANPSLATSFSLALASSHWWGPKKFTPDSAHAVHVSSAGIEKSQSSQTIPLCKSLSVVPRPLWKFWPWYPKDPLPFLNFLSIFLSSVLWLKIQKKVLKIGQIYIKK